jgi:hypothetical protein
MLRYFVFAFALCGAACGGTLVQGSADGGSDSSSGDSSSDAPGTDGNTDAPVTDGPSDSGQPWSPVCPEQEPAPGSSCTIVTPRDSIGVMCEYGKLQYDVMCDTVLQCQNGAWTSAFAGTTSCQPDGPNSPSCPATYEDIQEDEGGSCSNAGLRCEYPEGVCTCSMGFGGPVLLDAGTSWFCNPGAGCPMPRPRLGSSCSTNQQCTYLTCEFGESCTGGYWQGELEGCAEPGGAP